MDKFAFDIGAHEGEGWRIGTRNGMMMTKEKHFRFEIAQNLIMFFSSPSHVHVQTANVLLLLSVRTLYCESEGKGLKSPTF